MARSNGSASRKKLLEGRYCVVVGFDNTPDGEVAIDAAYEDVEGRDSAEIHVVHALGTVVRGPTTKSSLDKLSTKLDAAAAELRETFEGRDPAPPASSQLYLHTRLGGATQAILQLATDLDADLIVVGTRGNKGLKRVLLGSTAEELVKRAPCPVLVARHKDYSQMHKSLRIEPVCQACLAKRVETKGKEWWCTRHANETRLPVHVHHYGRFAPLSSRSADFDAP